MKKIFFVLLLLLLFGCRKDTEPQTPAQPVPASLLKQYNWQSVSFHQEKFAFDTSQTISYSDTTLYSFDETTFTCKRQNTVVRTVFGTGRPYYLLQQNNLSTEGQCFVNPVDSTIRLTYKAKTVNSPRNIPLLDTTVTETHKILVLSNNMLKLKLLPQSPSPITLVEWTATYYPVQK